MYLCLLHSPYKNVNVDLQIKVTDLFKLFYFDKLRRFHFSKRISTSPAAKDIGYKITAGYLAILQNCVKFVRKYSP